MSLKEMMLRSILRFVCIRRERYLQDLIRKPDLHMKKDMLEAVHMLYIRIRHLVTNHLLNRLQQLMEHMQNPDMNMSRELTTSRK